MVPSLCFLLLLAISLTAGQEDGANVDGPTPQTQTGQGSVSLTARSATDPGSWAKLLDFSGPVILSTTVNFHLGTNTSLNTSISRFSVYTVTDSGYSELKIDNNVGHFQYITAGSVLNASELVNHKATINNAVSLHTVVVNNSPGPITLDYSINAVPHNGWSVAFATAVGVIVLICCCSIACFVVGSAIYVHKKKVEANLTMANFKQEMRNPHDLVPLEDPGEL